MAQPKRTSTPRSRTPRNPNAPTRDALRAKNQPDPTLPKKQLHPALAANLDNVHDVLSLAHKVVKQRANIKRNLKQGNVTLPTLLTEPNVSTNLVGRFKVYSLLMAMPAMHKNRVTKLMRKIGINIDKKVSTLNERQRNDLIKFFAVDYPSITLEQASEDTDHKKNQSLYPPGSDGRSRAVPPWEHHFRSEEYASTPLARKNSRKQDIDWRERFIKELISRRPFAPVAAAKAANIPWKVARAEMETNEELRDVVDEIRYAMKEKILAVAWEEGVEGTESPIVWNGEIIGYKKTRDTSMLQFVAKALDPEMYDGKVRAARITANAMTDTFAQRQRMMEDARHKERAALWSAERAKVLGSGDGAEVIDADVVDEEDDDD